METLMETLIENMLKVILMEEDFEDIFQPHSREEFIQSKLKGCIKNNDGTYSCKGDVNLSDMGFKKLPVKFQTVGGDFKCSFNELITLEGAPSSVGGTFYCSGNELTTLEGAPSSVGGDFNCSYNKLITLEGAPSSVKGDFNCGSNSVSAEELKKTVDRDYL